MASNAESAVRGGADEIYQGRHGREGPQTEVDDLLPRDRCVRSATIALPAAGTATRCGAHDGRPISATESAEGRGAFDYLRPNAQVSAWTWCAG